MPQIPYDSIFLKNQGSNLDRPRTSKMIFWTVKYTNTPIQIHKYTNTAYDKVPEIPNILLLEFSFPSVRPHFLHASYIVN